MNVNRSKFKKKLFYELNKSLALEYNIGHTYPTKLSIVKYSTSWFLNLHPIDTLREITLCCGDKSVHCAILSSILASTH